MLGEIIPRDEIPKDSGKNRSGANSASPAPNRQSPVSNPQSLIPNPRFRLALFRALASLTLAVVLLGVYVPVLVWATLVEKWYGANAAAFGISAAKAAEFGMAVVHFGIYDTGWFTGIHVLLAVNILLAMLARLPWRRRHVGFLVTHAGVLLLLAGALTSRQRGMEATLSVVEGHDAHVAYQDSYHFEITTAPVADIPVCRWKTFDSASTVNGWQTRISAPPGRSHPRAAGNRPIRLEQVPDTPLVSLALAAPQRGQGV